MRLPLGAALLVLAASGCSADLPPLLNPHLNAAQIAALPARAGLRDAHYLSVFAGPDGTVYTQQSGTVQLKPVRALSQITTASPAKGGAFAPGEYREIDGTGYSEVLPGWTHPRWQATPNGSQSNNPVYFDLWSRIGGFQIEGQEGSAVDRAWRLVSFQSSKGTQGAVRIWIRQRDGYPLQYRLTFGKGTTTMTFDRWNSGARVSVPAAADLVPPPGNVPGAGQLQFTGGTLRVLSVDYAYHGSRGPSGATVGSHVVGVEVYTDAPFTTPVLADFTHWQLLDAAGGTYSAQLDAALGGSGNAGGDTLVFFTVPDGAAPPFRLHVVLTDIPGWPQLQGVRPPPGYVAPPAKVIADGLIKLS